MTPTALPAGLALLAALSPLLTILWLFQKKEWRLDRLNEHLRREGWQQFVGGTLRPLIAIPAVLLSFVDPTALWLGLGLLAGVGFIQPLLRRQHVPDWTTKSIAVTALSCLLTAVLIAAIATLAPRFLPLVSLVQGFIAVGAWGLLLPLDRRAKDRVFARARARRAVLPHITVIGIVGSVGKTTTKELTALVLGNLHPLVTPAHVNTELGLAQWFLRETIGWKPDDRHIVVVEMGAYRQGEIALIASVLQPQIAVVTALGSDHLALFGSEAAIVNANAEILAALPSDGTAILLADSPSTRSLQERVRGRVITAGTVACDLQATFVHESPQGLHFRVGSTDVHLPLAGQHNVGNAMLALAVGQTLGISIADGAARFAAMKPLPGTFQVRTFGGVRILDDTYNISPLSFKAALAWAGEQPERPRVLLTAGLLEVGHEEERFMRELGTIASGKIERAVIVGGHGSKAFAETFDGAVDSWPPTPVPPSGLLLCVGRLPASTINALLP